MEELAQTLRAERKRQGLRQDELAAVAGVGVRFVNELEAGKPTTQIGKVLQVVRALGLELRIVHKGRD